MCSSTDVLRPIVAERVHYFSRQLITADDMMAEQEYFRQKLRRHNRYLHGWGVVCGCAVQPYPDASHPWQIRICPGYIITPQGDEILIGEPVNFDVGGDSRQLPDPCPNPSPCPPVSGGVVVAREGPTIVYLAACYTECETRPVRVHPVGCACDESACDYSRIRDSFELMCSTTLPAPTDITLGSAGPSCPTGKCDSCVVLASITLPTVEVAGKQVVSRNTPIRAVNISYADRRILYSVAELPTRPTVILTSPLDGATGIATNSPIRATFDRKIDSASLTQNVMTVDSVLGTVSVDPADATGRTVMYMPTAAGLLLGMHTAKINADVVRVQNGLVARVKEGVRDLCGNTMSGDFSWNFTI